MNSYAAVCITIMMLFCEINSVPHKRNHLIRRERRNEVSSPLVQTSNQMQPISTVFPLAIPVPVSSTKSSGFSNSPNSVVPPSYSFSPGSEALPARTPVSVVNKPLAQVSSTLAPFLPTPLSQYSYYNPPQMIARRRRKNVPERNIKLENFFEKGKEFLKMTTEKQIVEEKASEGNQKDYGEYDVVGEKDDDNDDNDDDDKKTDDYITVAPIPNGVQMKTALKHKNNHIEKIVNISSSTLRIQTLDNTTEVQNVVEMQMEKKLEDDKGENQGLEKVRIVETELVKPVVHKKPDRNSNKKRRWHFPFSKSMNHRRTKRSNTNFEYLRSAHHFHRKMRSFPLDFKRKERMNERNTLLNQQEDSCSKNFDLGCTTNNFKEVTTEASSDRSLLETDEMGDFLKHFFSQLKKLKKAAEIDKNNTNNVKYANIMEKWSGPRLIKHRNHKFPEHLKMVMNLNMTWDTNIKNNLKGSPKTSGKFRNYIESLVSTEVPIQATTPQMAFKVLFVGDTKERDSKFFSVIILLSVMILLLPILACTVPKLYRTAQLAHRDSALKGYRVYRAPVNNRTKAHSFHGGNMHLEDVPQLEWQSESGDWLSEKELEFK